MARHPLILTSTLTKEPRYYVTSAWKVHDLDPTKPTVTVEVTGKKYDITDQIEKIVQDRIAQREHTQTKEEK